MAERLDWSTIKLHYIALMPLLMIYIGGGCIKVSLKAILTPGLPGELYAPDHLPSGCVI